MIPEGTIYPFQIGKPYSRRDVFRVIGLPEDTSGGPWFTGYAGYGPDYFIFCGVGVPGRTGHDYRNHFQDDRLVWFGKTRSSLRQPSIRRMLDPACRVYIFYRENEREHFTFAGLGRMRRVYDEVPVKVEWDLLPVVAEEAPMRLPEEIDVPPETVFEGARQTITVNVYERDPVARLRCIQHWGLKCSVCSFDFVAVYGELGKGFIHVHHLKPLGEIGVQYELDPINDLRPVCPNCHAMLHRARPALSLEQLDEICRKVSHLKSGL
jgi:5-methylcytosine-specific restriction protein A